MVHSGSWFLDYAIATMHSHKIIKIFLSASLKPLNPQVHIYGGGSQGPVSVYWSCVAAVSCCVPAALSHVFSSFQVSTRPSCHDLSSKYEVRGSRPAPAKAASPVVLISPHYFRWFSDSVSVSAAERACQRGSGGDDTQSSAPSSLWPGWDDHSG